MLSTPWSCELHSPMLESASWTRSRCDSKREASADPVGVGIMIAHNPLHRSGRAELPHPAPTLGKDAQAYERIRMTNARRREPTSDVAQHAAPRQVVTLAATAQDRPPQVSHRPTKRAQSRSVHGHSVV